jgi:hypothetical protein
MTLRRGLITLAVLFVAAVALMPWWTRPIFRELRQRLEKQVNEQCDSRCEFHLADLRLNWLHPGELVLENLRLHGGRGSGQEIDVRIPQLGFRVQLLALLDNQVRFGRIQAFSPQFVFYDLEHPARTPGNENYLRGLPDIEIETVQVKDGDFTYVRDVKGTHAVFHVHQISLASGALGSSPRLKDAPLQVEAAAQVESSGHVDLHVETYALRRPLQMDIDLKVKAQNLADLSRFFKPNAGVELNGILLSGHGVEHLHGRELRASLQAEYQDFTLKVDPMYDRSEVTAFFTNLGAGLALKKHNREASQADQTRAVHLARQPTESIVSFLLRGLKESSLDVAKAP